MGVEVLVIAIVAGVISLISGITSVATVVHVNRTLVSSSNDRTSVDISNKATDEEKSDGSKIHTREQKIHIEDIDTDFVSDNFSGTRTGLPNKASELLAKSGAGAINGLVKFKAPVVSRVIEEAKEEKETPIITEIDNITEITELKHGDQIDIVGSSSDSE
jgi:hypothetical protein